MATTHSRIGFGALVTYAGLVVATAIGLYALGAGSEILPSPFAGKEPDGARYGQVLVRSDDEGRCRKFSLDNRTHQLVDAGIVVCDRDRHAKSRPRTKADTFREAFGGQ